MRLLDDLIMYTRFVLGLREFLQTPITLQDALTMAQQRLSEREANFLRLIKHGIYENPRSPYQKLVRHARCTYDDLEKMTRAHGIEETLQALRRAGVFVTFEEFKGREPIVRDGLEMNVTPRDFDNPFLKHYYYGYSGGSSGAGTRVPVDLDFIRTNTPHVLLTQAAHQLLDMPRVLWLGIFPDSTGMNNILRLAPARQLPTRWFAPLTRDQVKTSRRDRLALRFILTMARICGTRIPAPEYVSLDNPLVIAQTVSELAIKRGACIVSTQPSKALRICLTAHEHGMDLTGVVFWSGGEPWTPAKARQIRLTGARHLPGYWITELGSVGMGCANPADENDIHFFHDDFALLTYPRTVPNSMITVESFHYTTLNAAAAKIMLNAESDDYGVVERRSCGCLLEQAGFHTHLREIRSFRKLTGEGATLVGSEMIRILEEVLPARFGGSPLDYQLAEEEDQQGFTRLNLLISPRVEIHDEAEVTKTVLAELSKRDGAADQARGIWQQAQTLRVQRREPVWTARGKLMPLHLEKRSGPDGGQERA